MVNLVRSKFFALSLSLITFISIILFILYASSSLGKDQLIFKSYRIDILIDSIEKIGLK